MQEQERLKAERELEERVQAIGADDKLNAAQVGDIVSHRISKIIQPDMFTKLMAKMEKIDSDLTTYRKDMTAVNEKVEDMKNKVEDIQSQSLMSQSHRSFNRSRSVRRRHDYTSSTRSGVESIVIDDDEQDQMPASSSTPKDGGRKSQRSTKTEWKAKSGKLPETPEELQREILNTLAVFREQEHAVIVHEVEPRGDPDDEEKVRHNEEADCLKEIKKCVPSVKDSDIMFFRRQKNYKGSGPAPVKVHFRDWTLAQRVLAAAYAMPFHKRKIGRNLSYAVRSYNKTVEEHVQERDIQTKDNEDRKEGDKLVPISASGLHLQGRYRKIFPKNPSSNPREKGKKTPNTQIKGSKHHPKKTAATQKAMGKKRNRSEEEEDPGEGTSNRGGPGSTSAKRFF